MNAPTEKERALANLRHLYQQMAGGQVKDSAQAKRIADGLLSPAIAKLEQAARRVPAVPVPDVTDAMIEAANEAYCPFGDMHLAIQAALAAAPQPPEAAPAPQFSRIAQKKLDYLLEAGEAITGYAIENKDGRRGAIDCHGFVYWWQDAAAPQPPEADHIPDAGKMDTNVRNWMNAALSKDVACPACGLSGLHACPSASTAESQGADAVKALEKVLRAVQRHLPPERIGERETIAEIISIVDPWPLAKPPANET